MLHHKNAEDLCFATMQLHKIRELQIETTTGSTIRWSYFKYILGLSRLCSCRAQQAVVPVSYDLRIGINIWNFTLWAFVWIRSHSGGYSFFYFFLNAEESPIRARLNRICTVQCTQCTLCSTLPIYSTGTYCSRRLIPWYPRNTN